MDSFDLLGEGWIGDYCEVDIRAKTTARILPANLAGGICCWFRLF